MEGYGRETRYLRLFLVRHGESRWNAAKARKSIFGLMKEVDHPLSDLGVSEAVQTNLTWRRLASRERSGAAAAEAELPLPMMSVERMSSTLQQLAAASEGASVFGDADSEEDVPAKGIDGDAGEGLLTQYLAADVLCSSPLSRALQTALLVLAGFGAERDSTALSSTAPSVADDDAMQLLPPSPREVREGGTLRVAVTKIHPVRGRFARVVELTQDGVATLNASKAMAETNNWPWAQVAEFSVDPKDDSIFRIVVNTAGESVGEARGGVVTKSLRRGSEMLEKHVLRRSRAFSDVPVAVLRFQAPTAEVCARVVAAGEALRAKIFTIRV